MKRNMSTILGLLSAIEDLEETQGVTAKNIAGNLRGASSLTDFESYNLNLIVDEGYVKLAFDALIGNKYFMTWAGHDLLEELRQTITENEFLNE